MRIYRSYLKRLFPFLFQRAEISKENSFGFRVKDIRRELKIESDNRSAISLILHLLSLLQREGFIVSKGERSSTKVYTVTDKLRELVFLYGSEATKLIKVSVLNEESITLP
jgi:hypothetical protein